MEYGVTDHSASLHMWKPRIDLVYEEWWEGQSSSKFRQNSRFQIVSEKDLPYPVTTRHDPPAIISKWANCFQSVSSTLLYRLTIGFNKESMYRKVLRWFILTQPDLFQYMSESLTMKISQIREWLLTLWIFLSWAVPCSQKLFPTQARRYWESQILTTRKNLNIFGFHSEWNFWVKLRLFLISKVQKFLEMFTPKKIPQTKT